MIVLVSFSVSGTKYSNKNNARGFLAGRKILDYSLLLCGSQFIRNLNAAFKYFKYF